MNVIELPIHEVIPDPANVRQHSDRNLAAIAGSLKRFGQVKPIVIDANKIVRAGNGTLAAALSLGWTTIKVVQTELAGSEATAFAIADNRVGSEALGSTFDNNALARTLAELKAEDDTLFESAGYTPDELASLIGQPQGAAEEQPPEDFPEVDEDIHTDFQCPRCSYAWSGKAAG